MTVFDERILAARRQRAAQALAGQDRIVLVAAGEPIPKPGGLDQVYPFIPHPAYYWLSGLRRPGGVLAFDPGQGWTAFSRPVSEAERLWEGTEGSASERGAGELPDWLALRAGRPVALAGAVLPQVPADPDASQAASQRLDAARRPKDRAELRLMERAVSATAAGFARLRELARPGMTERGLQIELEAEFFRHGADDLSFDTIVAAGSHAAALHFRPGQRALREGELLLVDAGASLQGYAADVTRTYPAGSRFTARQQTIYDLVLAAHGAAVALCRPGVEWFEVHRAAAGVLAQGLRDLGILRGEQDGLLESGAIGLFLPHGIGHLVGLGVRDAGGRASGRDERRCCGALLRVDLPLRQDFLATVEPGLYFAPSLLRSAAQRQRFGDAVAWDALDPWWEVGGVRIEDDILVTEAEPRNLTEGIPK